MVDDMMGPVSLSSLDDSLIERKQKENHELKKNNDKLHTKLSKMTEAKEKWNNKYNDLLSEYRKLQQENAKISKKLQHYEHEPIVMDVYDDGVDILYWDTETDGYELFASFSENNLERDLEEFCKEFIMELKDAYLVE